MLIKLVMLQPLLGMTLGLLLWELRKLGMLLLEMLLLVLLEMLVVVKL